MEVNRIILGDCLDHMREMPDGFVDCVITSPGYWQLRDYGWSWQWGLEPTFQEYLEHLWQMIDEAWRVLKPTGSAWINLGDSYARGSRPCDSPNQTTTGHRFAEENYQSKGKPDYKGLNKCLLLLPHRFAIGCIDRGWIMRNDIIWAKRNGMPESVTDRFSKKHEYFFFMVKQEKYYFDLDGIRDKHNSSTLSFEKAASYYRNKTHSYLADGDQYISSGGTDKQFCNPPNPLGKNPGSVSDFWDIPTQPSNDEHYAAYNDKLIGKPIVAGCPQYVCNKCGKPREKIIENTPMVIRRSDRRGKMGQPQGTASSGTMISPAINKVIGLTNCGCDAGFKPGLILDPFCGTATTGCRALELGRNFIGIDGSEKYVKMARKNIQPYLQQLQIF